MNDSGRCELLNLHPDRGRWNVPTINELPDNEGERPLNDDHTNLAPPEQVLEGTNNTVIDKQQDPR